MTGGNALSEAAAAPRVSPLVSVVIATYNRSRVLAHAIRSALQSTVQDLELLVVGDCCTDDTAEVVAGFEDPRIRFVNLPRNCGDQSGPTNHAISMASGRYVAFLNQDDLYFPDHLETAVAALRSGAGFVWTPTLVLDPVGDEAVNGDEWRVTLGSTPPGGAFDPLTFCVASSWVVDREALDRIGPWRSGRELYVSPSQEWMFRAWRQGVTPRFVPTPTVVVIYSGARPASYARRESPEHDRCAPRLAEPRFREALLATAAVAQAKAWNAAAQGSLRRRFSRAAAAPLRTVCAWCGLHPLSAHLLLRLHRRGTLISRHRRFTGVTDPSDV